MTPAEACDLWDRAFPSWLVVREDESDVRIAADLVGAALESPTFAIAVDAVAGLQWSATQPYPASRVVETLWRVGGRGVPSIDDRIAALMTLHRGDPEEGGSLLRGLGLASTRGVLSEVAAERERQEAKWGQQNHRDGLDEWDHSAVFLEAKARGILADSPTYAAIFMEEVGEALQTQDRASLRAELVQVAAVAAAWIEKLDRDAEREQGIPL